MRGFSVGEIPVNHRRRKNGRSKYNYMRTIKGLADLALLWFWRSYAVRPIHLLGGIGILLLATAGIFGLRTIYLFIADRKLSSTLEPLLTTFTFIAGLLFLSLGIVTDILIKIYYAITNEPYYSVKEVVRTGHAEVSSKGLGRSGGEESRMRDSGPSVGLKGGDRINADQTEAGAPGDHLARAS
jgi:hypothetical protein